MPMLATLGLPSLTPDVLASFSSHGILSVEDFLLAGDISRLEATGNGVQRKAVTEILHYLEQQSWGFRTSAVMLQELQDLGIQYLPTGSESLDRLLHGGLREGTVTELVGSSSSGKTQVCMQVAASVAYYCQSMVAYVDTCHSFSSTRLSHMLGGLVAARDGIPRAGAAEEITKAMKGIVHYNVFDIFSMLSLLHQLHVSIGDQFQGEEKYKHMRLIIVDSASSVISPILVGNHNQGHALMVSMGIALKKLALENHLAVLITNHTVGGEGGQPKPALGESWKSMPHVRLLLERDPISDVCQASIVKHTSIACNSQVAFRITRTGLKPLKESPDS